MSEHRGSDAATALADRLAAAGSALAALVDELGADRWTHVHADGAWSIGREVEHVADAAASHQWIVRHTIGDATSGPRPTVDRSRRPPAESPRATAALLRQRTREGVELLRGLTDEQLALPTRPPRRGGEVLAATIDRVLIGHYDEHRLAIEARARST